MSAWTDRILQEFPADLFRFWIACDPDDLLLDERILHGLRERGFEVLPFKDPVAFRTEYEERYRAAWDRGDEGTSKALVLQLRGTDLNTLPWDYVRMGRKVSLSLADLFPRLSYGVIRQLDSEHHEALFLAHNKHATQPLGEGATKDFILTHIFRISPYLLSRPEDFWREVLRLHYRGAGLPDLLARHVEFVLDDTPLSGISIRELLSSKSYMVHAVQEAWRKYLHQFPSQSSTEIADSELEELSVNSIPFSHPDVSAIVDSMFFDGILRPVQLDVEPTGLPTWARVGVQLDPAARARELATQSQRLCSEVPEVTASLRDWMSFSRKFGAVLHRFHELEPGVAAEIGPEVTALQVVADRQLRNWVEAHYADLPSLPVARSPALVHQVPRYLLGRRESGETRIALIVADGLAIDQWAQIKDYLLERTPGFLFDEMGCFAWLPTLTSVSRQALLSGSRPREFAGSIEVTTKEPMLWEQFWLEAGLAKTEIFYRKGLSRTNQLVVLSEQLSDERIKMAAIVVDTVDQLVHGAVLGKRGVAGQISDWCKTGFIERLIAILLDRGFQIYLTADHGNVDAHGIGRINDGIVSEIRAQRVQVYRSDALIGTRPSDVEVFRMPLPGLPSDYHPVFAEGRGAFINKGDEIVAHGGISVEELIVPFVRVSLTRPSI